MLPESVRRRRTEWPTLPGAPIAPLHRRVPLVAGLFALAVGALACAGWVWDVSALKSLLPGMPTMKANTAVCFMMIGLAMFWMRDDAPRLAGPARILALAVLVIAALSLAESFTGVNLGLDELLFRDPGNIPPGVPGRMSPVTATCFLLLVAALLMRHPVTRSQIMGLMVLLLSGFVVIGYLYHSREIIIYSTVAAPTAITLCVLSLGVLGRDAHRGMLAVVTGAGSGGTIARRLLPASFIVSILFGWLTLLGQRAGWYDLNFGMALQTVALATTFTALIWVGARLLGRTDMAIEASHHALLAAHAELESRVSSRTAELDNVNQALVLENAERRRAEAELLASRNSLTLATTAAKIGIWDWDVIANKLAWDAQMYVLYGLRVQDFGGAYDAWKNGLHPDDRNQGDADINAALAGTREFNTEFRLLWPNGEVRHIEAHARVLRAGDGSPVRMIGVNWDITERKRAEAELHRFRAELEQRIAETTTANNALQDQTLELLRVNAERAALRHLIELLTACANSDEAYEIFRRAAGGLFPDLAGVLHIYSASRDRLAPAASWGDWPVAAMPAKPQNCWGIRAGKAYAGNGTTTAPCGHAGPAQGLATLCVPLAAYGDVLGVLHLRGMNAATVFSALPLASLAGDGLALALANLGLRESLHAQTIRDPLTDLFNRRYLTETLEREFARAQRTATTVAVIMLDVDHFKTFNDGFGHDAGDAVLRALASLFRKAIRTEDIACRYGGEEFCLVMPQMDLDGGRRRAESIRVGAMQLEITSQERMLGPVTLSLGVALFPGNGTTGAAVLAAADGAMYEAKQAGRNRVVVAGAGDATPR